MERAGLGLLCGSPGGARRGLAWAGAGARGELSDPPLDPLVPFPSWRCHPRSRHRAHPGVLPDTAITFKVTQDGKARATSLCPGKVHEVTVRRQRSKGLENHR